MKKLRLASVLISIVLQVAALFLLVGSSIAWLSSNLDITTKQQELQLDAKGLKIAKYNVYKYNYQTNQIDNVYNENDQYELTSYDSIFTERNENTLLIFEVFLYNFDPGKSNLTVYVDRESHTTAWNDTESCYTSNLIYIKAQTGGALGIDSTASDSAKFYAARDAFQKIALRNEFVTIGKNAAGDLDYTNVTSTNRITLQMTLTDEEKAKISDATNGRTTQIPVYFIFDYDEALIGGQNISHFSDITIITNEPVKYENDITNFLFVQ